MLINRLFKGLAVILTAVGTIVIIWQAANLVQQLLSFIAPPNIRQTPFTGLTIGLAYALIIRNTKLLLIAIAVEITLIWLLVVLDVVSRRRGLIATLILFVIVGIVVFIVYSLSPGFAKLPRDLTG